MRDLRHLDLVAKYDDWLLSTVNAPDVYDPFLFGQKDKECS